MNRGHHLSHGVERRFADSRSDLAHLILVKIKGESIVDKCNLGGLACGLAILVNIDVGTHRHRGGKQLLIITEMVGDSHFVLGEGSGFVRAYYLGAAECFNGCELADNRIFLGHVGNADG